METNTMSNTPKVSYPSLAEMGNRTHVSVIQGLIIAGQPKGDILDAYVSARFPEIEAGTLLREDHGATPRVLDDPKKVAKAKALLRKHGNTHYKMADAEMSEGAIAARVQKAADSVQANADRLQAAKDREREANAQAKALKARKTA